ncbi:MAG: hypothetical protein ABSG79_13910 [Bryobacteraceae bacterium]|jgi:hypothetical protein
MCALRYALCAAILAVPCAQATSIVIKLSDQRILIAADTLGIDSAGIVHQDQCKILLSGKAAFSAVSISSFSPTATSGSNWDAKSEAQSAFAVHKDDIEAAGNEWRSRAERYFGSLAGPDRLRAWSLVDGDPDHVLVAGVFAGWDAHGAAELIYELVRFEEPGLANVQHRREVLRSRQLPYTTNVVTQELIEGNSTRAEAARLEWQKKSREFSAAVQVWRRLEFLIVKTSEWTKVGKRVDILELNRDGPSMWLQNLTCQN